MENQKNWVITSVYASNKNPTIHKSFSRSAGKKSYTLKNVTLSGSCDLLAVTCYNTKTNVYEEVTVYIWKD